MWRRSTSLVARIEPGGAHVPGALDREQRVDHGVEARARHRLDRAQGSARAKRVSRSVRYRAAGVIVEDEITECLPDDAIEEAGEQSRRPRA